MKIGEIARQAGVSIDTIRFYERRGVLPAAARRPSGYREYGEDAVRRIRLARQMQALGLSLDEIVEALAAHDAGRATCASERWRLDAALARVDARIAELKALRREIVSARTACERGACRFELSGTRHDSGVISLDRHVEDGASPPSRRRARAGRPRGTLKANAAQETP